MSRLATDRSTHPVLNVVEAPKHFVWKDLYNVGDSGIDAQHRRLFDLANGLLHAGNEADLEDAAAQLHKYVRSHFRVEEHLMRRVGFPHLREHQDLHRGLIERLDAIGAKIASGLPALADLQVFMNEWLVGHIIEQDTRLANFVAARAGIPRAE